MCDVKGKTSDADTVNSFKKRNPVVIPGSLLSSFPSLALTRSGNVGIFSDSFQKHPKKREHYNRVKNVPVAFIHLIIFSHYRIKRCFITPL